MTTVAIGKPRAGPAGVVAGLLYLVLFWGALVACGFPPPYWDDSIILAPSLSIIDSATLSNIYLSRRFYPGDTYLFYPPTFSWVCAGWLAIFGRSFTALAWFWAACGIAASAALGSLLARFVRPPAAWLAAPLLLVGAIAFQGFRYEILGFATMLGALALLESGRRPVRFAGYVLLFATPTVAPTFLFTATLAAAVTLWRARAAWRGEAALVVPALVVAVAILWLGTLGHLSELVRTMYAFRTVRVGIGGRGEYSLRLLVMICCLAGAAAILFRLAGHRLRARSGIAAVALLLVALGGTLLTHARYSLVTAASITALTLAAMAMAEWIGRNRLSPIAARTIALVAVACVAGVTDLSYATRLMVRPLPSAAIARARAAAAQLDPRERLVVDSQVMREVFAFPAGRRVEDAMVRNPWPNFAQDLGAIPQGEHWIVSRSTLEVWTAADGGGHHPNIIERFLIAVGIPRTNPGETCLIQPGGPTPAQLVAETCRPR